MSTTSEKGPLSLEIVDGENVLALLAQLADLARRHTGPRFGVKVEYYGETGDVIMGIPQRDRITAEIGLNITGLSNDSTDGEFWEIEGNIDDDFLVEPQNRWLSRLLSRRGAEPLFSGDYDTNKRRGKLVIG